MNQILINELRDVNRNIERLDISEKDMKAVMNSLDKAFETYEHVMRKGLIKLDDWLSNHAAEMMCFDAIFPLVDLVTTGAETDKMVELFKIIYFANERSDVERLLLLVYYAVYEKKIDKVIAAGKPVKKELDSIRSKTKSLPALLGGEPSIKISEKDFERVMEMAQASGTLEKLNEAYDKDMDTMQRKIDKLTSQVSSLKDKISKAETFLKVKGLLEEFLDYLKPKSISRSLSEKKKEVEEYDKTHAKKVVKKDRGIAV